MGGGTVGWDSSVVFAEARNLTIEDNLVQANGWNLNQTYTGIEVYGQQGTIIHNQVERYHTGIIFGGWNLTVADNTFPSQSTVSC
jgi:hypothetical protein